MGAIPMTDQRTIRVERRSYSRSPWRLIDSQTGNEITVDSEPFDHPDLGPMTTAVPGYATKAEAVEALGRLAALTHGLAVERNRLRAGIAEKVGWWDQWRPNALAFEVTGDLRELLGQEGDTDE